MADVTGYTLPGHEETYMYADKFAREEIAAMGDVVVEQGISDIWGYRKWNSGIAECWCRHYTDITPSNHLNSVYYSPTISVGFPFTFTAVPTVSITGGSTSAVNWAREFASNTTHASYIVCSNEHTGDQNVTIDIHAIGRWK